MPTVYFNVCVCVPFVILCHLGLCRGGYLQAQARLYTSSPRIHSFCQLRLSPFTPSICLQHSAEEEVKRCVERA